MKDNNFNFLRYYAAIGVLIGHVATHMDIPFMGYGINYEKPFYHLGVPFFFIINGLFLYNSYVNMKNRGEGIREFMFNRLKTLAPSLYFYMLMTIALLFAIGAISFNVFTDKGFFAWIFSNLILFPVYHPSTFSHIGVGALNGSLWTIVAQLSFFIFIPIIFRVEKKIGFRNMILGLMILGVIGFALSWAATFLPQETFLIKVYNVIFIPHLIYFSLGILWSRIWNSVLQGQTLFWISITLVILFRIDVLGLGQYLGDLVELIWAVPFSYAIVWFGYNGLKFFRKFNKLENLGMGIYIWHMVVVNILLYLGINKVSYLSGPLMFLVVLILTIVLAYISRVIIEKPASNLKIKPRKKITEYHRIAKEVN